MDPQFENRSDIYIHPRDGYVDEEKYKTGIFGGSILDHLEVRVGDEEDSGSLIHGDLIQAVGIAQGISRASTMLLSMGVPSYAVAASVVRTKRWAESCHRRVHCLSLTHLHFRYLLRSSGLPLPPPLPGFGLGHR